MTTQSGGAWSGKRWGVGAALLVGLVVLARCAPDYGGPFDSGGAYIQNVTQNAASVAVLSAWPSLLKVEVSLANDPRGAVVASAEDPAPMRCHELRVTGLTPDTRYGYVVQDAGSSVEVCRGELTTAPLPGARRVRVAVLGDSGGVRGGVRVVPKWMRDLFDLKQKPRRQAEIAGAIAARRPDLVLHTGDLVYSHGERERYAEAYFRPFSSLTRSVPVYPVIGNHDAKSDRAAPYLEAFQLPTNDADGSERYYSFDYGDLHVVCLDTDTSDLGAGSAQARWLEADLQASQAAWKVAVLHHPPRSQGRHADAAVAGVLHPLFRRYKVALVLAGHDHNYQRFHAEDGVHYVVTGGGGGTLYDVTPAARLAASAARHHFVWLEVDARRLLLTAVDLDGRVLDLLTLVQSP